MQGDVTNQHITLEGGITMTVAHFIESYFGFPRQYLGICVAVLCGFIATFCLAVVLGLKVLNFQSR